MFNVTKRAKGRETPRLKKSKEAPELNAICQPYLDLALKNITVMMGKIPEKSLEQQGNQATES